MDNLNIGTDILNINGRADKPGISIIISKTDKKTDNLGIATNIPDIDKRANNSSTNTLDIDNTKIGTNNLSIGTDIPHADERSDNPGTDTNTADGNGGAHKSGISTNIIDINADRLAAASDKVCASLMFLCKALFFVSFFKSETVFISLPSSIILLLSLLILLKQEVFFCQYPTN